MGYDFDIVDEFGDTLSSPSPHGIAGGQYAVGEDRLRFYATYNYAPHFCTIWPEDGIRWIDGKRVIDTLPELLRGIEVLSKDPEANTVSESYWTGTVGNALAALRKLVALATYGLRGTWKIS